MVGVSAPILRRSPGEFRNFIYGYSAGYLAGATLVGLVIYSLGEVLGAVAPLEVRGGLLGLILVSLGMLDAFNRTPYTRRQVPQRHVRNLGPGWRGMIWAADLALLFTTQKTTSLVWAALLSVVFVAPSLAAFFVAIMVVVAIGSLIIGTLTGHIPGGGGVSGGRYLVRGSRVITGIGLTWLGVNMLLTVW
jgi:hypothetical protein